MPKIGCALGASIWAKIFRDKSLAESYVADSEHVVNYSRKVNAFMQVLDFVPQVRDGEGKLRPPSEFKPLCFASAKEAAAAYCLLNTTLFRWFMDVVSDGSHLNRRELDNFPFDPKKAAGLAAGLPALSKRLTQKLKQTSETRVMNINMNTLTVQCIIGKHAERCD